MKIDNVNMQRNEIGSLNDLNLKNAVSFIGNTNRSTYDFLYKIKVIVNMLFNNNTFMELIRYSTMNINGDKSYILGNSAIHNFIITSIVSNRKNEESYMVVMKYIQKITGLQNEPGTINRITLKRLKFNEIYWNNKAEISFMNTKGNEYIVKISFFNNN